MSHTIPYGSNSRLELRVPPNAELIDCTVPNGRPLDDPVAAVATAMENPLEFPPLASATIPGDRIVLALGRGVPRADAVIAGVVHCLMAGGVEASQMSIVCEEREQANSGFPTSLLAGPIQREIPVLVHDPEDIDDLCYLASSKEALPIYFNRAIGEADVVVPISSLRLQESLAYMGVHGGLFPGFSDRSTKERFSIPKNLRGQDHLLRRRQEADEAAWLLGVQFTLQVIPGPGNSLLHVLAGDAAAVSRDGQKLCQAAWLYPVPQKAGLVVASIEGGPEHQTWENFARALFAASQIVQAAGTIVLCTELDRHLGPALQRLRSTHFDEKAMRDFGRDQSPDAISASIVLEAREQANVYLMSGLDGTVVEELGLGHVADPGEVERLSQRHDSCILLANAHQAVGQVQFASV